MPRQPAGCVTSRWRSSWLHLPRELPGGSRVGCEEHLEQLLGRGNSSVDVDILGKHHEIKPYKPCQRGVKHPKDGVNKWPKISNMGSIGYGWRKTVFDCFEPQHRVEGKEMRIWRSPEAFSKRSVTTSSVHSSSPQQVGDHFAAKLGRPLPMSMDVHGPWHLFWCPLWHHFAR